MHLSDLPHRPRGPRHIPSRLRDVAGTRELDILNSRDTCDFSHLLNRDCDFYLRDTCVTYSSPTLGFFTWCTVTNTIVG